MKVLHTTNPREHSQNIKSGLQEITGHISAEIK